VQTLTLWQVDGQNVEAHQATAFWSALAKLGKLEALNIFFLDVQNFSEEPLFFQSLSLMTQIRSYSSHPAAVHFATQVLCCVNQWTELSLAGSAYMQDQSRIGAAGRSVWVLHMEREIRQADSMKVLAR